MNSPNSGYQFNQNLRSFNHNLSYQNAGSFSPAYYDGVIENNIFWDNQVLFVPGFYSNAIFRNNIFQDSLPATCIDGGGNLVADPLIAFTETGINYLPGSPCIDAGFDDSNLPDMYNHIRPFDGNNDGFAQCDIGPVEYGSTPIGKLTGTVTANSEEPVSYVLLYVENNPALYTVADNNGFYNLDLMAGTYQIKVQRPFYRDADFTVTIGNGEIQTHNFNIEPTTAITEEVASSPVVNILQAFPNPFHGQFNLKVELAQKNRVEMTIYNIKGQKVKSILPNSLKSGLLQLQWDGKDENGSQVGSGIYFCRYRIGESVNTRKIVRLK
jgi:hypothetical protein